MKKAVMLTVLVFLLVLSTLVMVQDENSCSGWFGWLRCFFGFSEEKGALVGE